MRGALIFSCPKVFDVHRIDGKREEVLLWELLQCCDGDISAMQENAASSLEQSPLPSVLA